MPCLLHLTIFRSFPFNFSKWLLVEESTCVSVSNFILSEYCVVSLHNLYLFCLCSITVNHVERLHLIPHEEDIKSFSWISLPYNMRRAQGIDMIEFDNQSVCRRVLSLLCVTAAPHRCPIMSPGKSTVQCKVKVDSVPCLLNKSMSLFSSPLFLLHQTSRRSQCDDE